MHIQAKAQVTASPADLAKFLKVLVGPPEDEINIEGVTGARIEADPAGEFVFAVEHGRAGDAHDRLVEAGYTVQWTTDLYKERIPGPLAQDPPDPNQPGVLLGIIERATESGIAAGREIDTVLVGLRTGQPGVFGVQVTFIGSAWSTDHPGPADDDDDD